jgi:hypothetical protein
VSAASDIVAGWKAPWQSVDGDAAASMQAQLDREVGFRHPLRGKHARVLGRRIDNDDVVARLEDGTLVNVHLVWGSSSIRGSSAKYPTWFAYGSAAEFAVAMQTDAAENDARAESSDN